ncbi:dicarboxylate/amino acid:cation symporter [Halobacteriovorax sp. JY17]|uniref:dicarboxylate/amino acid:cation symporter n=1 Tax=Halobacteriovorax sp. JY17 TaxID=2014617 RepID=UPI0025C56F08|nr:dicarboxylate/amino acid:cation symporter [Halobacteriovorax sp. JY17]
MQEASKKEAKLIGIAMIAGLIAGLALYFSGHGEMAAYLKPIGTIFIRLLKMVIVPLVLSSIFMAMYHLGTPESLGSMGRKAVGYYFLTTAFAVFLGLIMVNLINPGVGVEGIQESAGLHGLSEVMHQQVTQSKGLYQTILDVIVNAIPTNPFEAMATSTVLQVIVFAIMFGIVALYMPKKALPVVSFMESLEAMTLRLTHVIMKFAPIGIFVLMMDIMARTGFSAIVSLSKYMATVIIGLLLHAVALMAIASWRMKKSPMFILKSLSSPLLTAFSTSSSAATLPITMTCVEENLGVRKDTAKFVLPLGATINMDGTALYESVAAIFIAQVYGIELGIGQQVVIFMTASLAAIGAAAIPGAGLITMSIVLGAVGLPIEGIGLILAVDRILDMFRTTVNVFGDCVGTIVVDSMMDNNEFSGGDSNSLIEGSVN